jgi:hypothetical protein
MENESIGKRGMGINYKGSQGQTKRAVVLQDEEDRELPSNPRHIQGYNIKKDLQEIRCECVDWTKKVHDMD